MVVYGDLSLSFALIIIIEDLFLYPCNDITEKQDISLPRKKTCFYGEVINLMFLTKSIRIPNAQVVLFPYIFQVAVDCG